MSARGCTASAAARAAAGPLLAAVLAMTALSGCAPARGGAYDRAFAEAARAEGAGRLDEATRGYDLAAKLAARPRDADEARWCAAATLERSGDVGAAIVRFAALASDATSEHGADAAYRAALLSVEHGDEEHGWRDMEQVPRRFASHGVAHAAVRRLVEHADERGARAGLDELHALERDVGSTELGGLVAYLTAEHLEELGELAAARDAYVGIADRWPYPRGAFFDDALWRASALDDELGRPRAAIDDLERMLRERETTTIVGSYERPKYVPAILRVGALYRDRLHDHARARDAFHRLYAEFTYSSRRDDGLWLEASLWREDGNPREACARLATLVREFPDSRYVPCATTECALARPTPSAAPTDCRPYVARRADAGD